METIELARVEGAQWRWAYSDGNGTRIASNDVYPTLEEATDAARAAYPDLELSLPADALPGRPIHPRRSRLLRILGLVALALIVVALGWSLAERGPE